MAYCTQANVVTAAGGEKRLQQLADYDRDGTADSTTIAEAIAASDAWIDGELAKRLSVPLTVVPELIKTISMDEAVFILKRRRNMATQDDRDDHAERLEMLQHIKTGASTVGTDPSPAKSTQVVDTQSVRPTTKATSRANMKGFW